MARITAAYPQALIAWTTGAPVATVFKGITQAGLAILLSERNARQHSIVFAPWPRRRARTVGTERRAAAAGFT